MRIKRTPQTKRPASSRITAAPPGARPWPPWPRPGVADYNDTRLHSQLGCKTPSSLPSPAIRDGIWRCAMSTAPRQPPSLPPPNRANPTAKTNSGLDKTWGQGQKRSAGAAHEKHRRAEPRGRLIVDSGRPRSPYSRGIGVGRGRRLHCP
jgi:hypothetical protein